MERTRSKAGVDKKRLQVNSAALVDLKAALFRKQQEYKKEKSSFGSSVTATTEGSGRKVSDKTASVWLTAGKKAKKKEGNQRVNERSSHGGQSDTTAELTKHEEEQLERSRRALEAKAAIYDRLSRGSGLREEEEDEGEEGDPRYMVDFTKKIWEDHMISQSPPVSPSSTRHIDSSSVSKERGSPKEEREPTPPPSSADEEWVEYVDSFGRSRSCLRKDLPQFMELDQQHEAKREERKKERKRSPTPELLSEDMRRERERKQWERDAEDELDEDKPVGPVHYQEVRAGEVRTHGTAYYAFSVDEEKRREQIGLLNKLREQTFIQREKREKVQEKRKAILESRLAKVRERKLKQKLEESTTAGPDGASQAIADFGDFDKGPTEGSKEENKMERNEDLSMLLARAKEQADQEQEMREEEKRRAHVRPWDRGKVVDVIKKRKQELRDERLNEFAPPSIYSSSKPSDQAGPTKKPRTDLDSSPSTTSDVSTTTTTASTASGVNLYAGGVAASQATATPFYPTAAGGYFYPPGLYPPPFGVQPPPPPPPFPGMPFAPPPPGGPYYAPPPPPPPPMGMGVAYQHTPSATVQMQPPPPPPGLPPDV